MSEIQVEMTVTKMKIGNTSKDEREESSGLKSILTFEVVSGPRPLARLANLLKQGEVNISLIVKATNAATDAVVTVIDLPHQMGLGEKPAAPAEPTDKTANAAFPPVAADKLEPGVTPVRTGEPIDPAKEAEANAEFEKMGAGPKKSSDVVIVDLTQFSVEVLEGDKGYKVALDGVKKKGPDLVGSILTVFNSKAVVCRNALDLSDTLLLYPQTHNRDLLLEILQSGKMPETVTK